MSESSKKLKVVIVGGGTAGWLSAAAISRQMKGAVEVTLIESSELGTVGVGEATIPPMRTFHKLLGIDEREFMRTTHATFKLGIQFENWKVVGEKYFHSFGVTGKETLITEFIHFWLKGKDLGITKEFGDYCLEHKAGLNERVSAEPELGVNYAFHLDAGLYAKYLRQLSESAGAQRIEGKVVSVEQNKANGFIVSVAMESGQKVDGDFFIDCSGFKGLLIEQALHTGYEDWSHWLPCNSAVAIQTESCKPAVPYTRSIAHHAGWRWQIPLQHRVGNGLVFCDRYMSADEAASKLLNDIDGNTINEPRLIPFKTGRRRKIWNKNCLAVGLSSGFLEPLESTSIHLIMTTLTRFLQMFPGAEIHQSVQDEFNNQCAAELEKIRDFIVLHYKATERDDSGFWRYCKNMEVPAELAHRIKLFEEAGKLYLSELDLFRLDSWTQVMLGQGITPKWHHPIVDTMEKKDLQRFLEGLASMIDSKVARLPMHETFVMGYCGINNFK